MAHKERVGQTDPGSADKSPRNQQTSGSGPSSGPGSGPGHVSNKSKQRPKGGHGAHTGNKSRSGYSPHDPRQKPRKTTSEHGPSDRRGRKPQSDPDHAQRQKNRPKSQLIKQTKTKADFGAAAPPKKHPSNQADGAKPRRFILKKRSTRDAGGTDRRRKDPAAYRPTHAPHTVREAGSVRLRTEGEEQPTWSSDWKEAGEAKSGAGRGNRRRTSSQPAGGPNRRQGGVYRRMPRARKRPTQNRTDKNDRLRQKTFDDKRKAEQTRINVVPKSIDIMDSITVSDLARKMNLKASELITKLMSMGMMVSINEQIDSAAAEILAAEYNCKVNIVSLYDETIIESEVEQDADLQPRPPVVVVMGHVDHGKTKLLDAIRATDVASGEFGGITQHIGAYQVDIPQGKVTLLDTPGHEAFTLMRLRGARITDIVVLVVAATDGVMAQTKEAIAHARAANVPIIVAINKIDLPDANPDRVKQQLSEFGLVPEEWGGDTIFCAISALKKEGVHELLEAIVLQSEVLELKAAYQRRASGRVIEARIDAGRGVVSTVLIESGTLHIGDGFVAGVYPGRVRTMLDDHGTQLKSAIPSTPVEVMGCTGMPKAGDPFQVTSSEKVARQIGARRQELQKLERVGGGKKVTLDNLYESIQKGKTQELKIIVKGDVDGSVEAIRTSLEKLTTTEIRLSVIYAAAGAINEKDIMLAAASEALVIGFHVHPTSHAQALADREKVEIRKYNIIYDVIDGIKAAMEGMLEPEVHEKQIGRAEVRDLFKNSKIGTIAGCYVVSGKVRRSAKAVLIREGVEVYSGALASLRRFKDDVREVESNYECGISIAKFNDIKVGDQIEFYETGVVARKLDDSLQRQAPEKAAVSGASAGKGADS